MKRIIMITAVFLFLAGQVCAGEYDGITPGVSTKTDADKAFGSPVKVSAQGKQLDYSTAGHDLARLSVVLAPGTDVVRKIHLVFQKPYAKTQVKEWFRLKEQPDATEEVQGHRVEFFEGPGVKIVLEDRDENGRVIQLSHVDVAPESALAAPLKTAVTSDSCPAAAEKYAQQADPFIAKDQYQQAIAPLKKAAMCDPDRAVYASTLAYAYLKADRLNDAVTTAKALVDRTEDYVGYSVLGNAYVQKNDCRAAIPYLEKAVTFKQDQPLQDNMEFLGVCYYKDGRLNEALKTLVKSYKRNKKSPLSVYFLAATSDRLGNKADAKFYYKKYLGLRHKDKDMNSLAKERLRVLNREQSQSTREKTSQATQAIIKTIFGSQ